MRVTRSSFTWVWTLAGAILYALPMWLPAISRLLGLADDGLFEHGIELGWFLILAPVWFVIGTVLAFGAVRQRARFSGWLLSVNLVLLLVSLVVASAVLILTTADPAGSLT